MNGRIAIAGAVLVLEFSSIVTAADWPQLGCTPQRTSRSPEPLSPPPEAQWTRLWIKSFWPDRVHNAVQAIIVSGRVYLGSKDGTVWCLNGRDGQEIWTAKGLGCINNTLACAGATIVVASLDGVFGLDARTGRKLWTIEEPMGFTTAPLVADGRVYVGGRDGAMLCINPADGKTLWRHNTGSNILQSAAYDDGRIFFATEDLYMRCLDARTGEQLWQSGPYRSQTFVHFYPVVHEGLVIFRGQFTQAVNNDAEFGVFPFTADGGWGEDGKKAIAMIPSLRKDLAEGKPLPPEFDAAGEKIVQIIKKEPWRQDMWVLDAKSGREAFVVPHFPGLGSLGLGGPPAPPAVDRDGMLVYQIAFAGHPFGRLDLQRRRVADILLNPYTDKPAGQGNPDEFRSVSTAGDLIFLVHEGEAEAATFAGGVFNLKSRTWWSKPRSHPGTGSGFEHQGAPASISEGRFYHLSYDSLECWGLAGAASQPTR